VSWADFEAEHFGAPYEIWHDGFDEAGFDRMAPATREKALAVLPEGLAAQSAVAAAGARRLGASHLLPQLEDLVLKAAGGFAVEAARAVRDLGGHHRPALLQLYHLLINDPFRGRRIDVAVGLRHFPQPETTEILLRSVAGDPEYLVRYHAAESLLRLGGIVPAGLSDHDALFQDVAAGDGEEPTDDLRARWRRAADGLQEMLS
jgi:hypothetical protein